MCGWKNSENISAMSAELFETAVTADRSGKGVEMLAKATMEQVAEEASFP